MDLNNHRLHLYPKDRIATAATIAACVGAGQGFYAGVKMSSLRYLTENAHRLPRTVGGWYFYHKKKNYVMLLAGCKDGARLAARYAFGVGAFLAAEAALDRVRGTTDFLSTAFCGAVASFGYGSLKHMSRVQRLNYVKRGTLLGLFFGISQDIMIHSRGGYVWYMEKLNLKSQAEKAMTS